METYLWIMKLLSDAKTKWGYIPRALTLNRKEYYELIECITCFENRQIKITDSFTMNFFGQEVTIKLDQEEKKMEEKLDLDTIGALVGKFVKVKSSIKKTQIIADLRRNSHVAVHDHYFVCLSSDGVVYQVLPSAIESLWVEPIPPKPAPMIVKRAKCLLETKDKCVFESGGIRTLREHEEHYLGTIYKVIRYPVGKVHTFYDGVLQE